MDAQGAARDWLDAAFGVAPVASGVDRRGPWIGLIGLSLCVLVGLGAGLSPKLAARAPLAPGRFYALATPLLLWKAPTGFLPILLGDYLAAHFAIYGALLWAGLLLLRRPPGLCPSSSRTWRWRGFTSSPSACRSIFTERRSGRSGGAGRRSPLETLAVALAFSAEERLARGEAGPRFAYSTLKLGFIVLLIAAIALNPMRLFFLALVAPVVAVLFVAFGFLNRAAYRRTLAPLAAALALAYAISVTFPMVERPATGRSPPPPPHRADSLSRLRERVGVRAPPHRLGARHRIVAGAPPSARAETRQRAASRADAQSPPPPAPRRPPRPKRPTPRPATRSAATPRTADWPRTATAPPRQRTIDDPPRRFPRHPNEDEIDDHATRPRNGRLSATMRQLSQPANVTHAQ